MSAQSVEPHHEDRKEKILAEKAAGMSISETAKLLATIAGYHPAFPVTESTVAAWAAALQEQKIDSLPDAVRAVVRFYGDPSNTDPWIKPWDVVRGVRALWVERTRGVSLADVDMDLDPADVPRWVEVVNRRMAAVADGRMAEVQQEIAANLRALGR